MLALLVYSLFSSIPFVVCLNRKWDLVGSSEGRLLSGRCCAKSCATWPAHSLVCFTTRFVLARLRLRAGISSSLSHLNLSICMSACRLINLNYRFVSGDPNVFPRYKFHLLWARHKVFSICLYADILVIINKREKIFLNRRWPYSRSL